MLGLLVALLVVWLAQRTSNDLSRHTFQIVVLISLIPAALAVISLAVGAQDVEVSERKAAPKITFKGLGRPFVILMVIVGIFDLGNSSDAFLVLRAQERGLNVLGVLGMLATFNLVYTLISTPAGSLSDRIGRRTIIIGGWLVYAAIYLGFALAGKGWHVWVLYAIYGFYYGLAYGTTKAMGRRHRAGGTAGNRLWHLQRRAWHHRFSGLAHRRHPVGWHGWVGVALARRRPSSSARRRH